MKRVHQSVILHCGPKEAWTAVKTSDLLRFVAFPLFRFKAVETPALPAEWEEGQTVKLRSYMFGIIPFGGVRDLYFDRVDDHEFTIQTREKDAVIRKWDHLIQIRAHGEKSAIYSDCVEIDAGLLTWPVYLFAQLFYWHRQMRWRSVAGRLKQHGFYKK